MNAVTEKMVVTALEMDPSVSKEQRSLTLRILKSGVHEVTAAFHVSAMRESKPASQKPTGKPYLRRHEAADYLGCSVRQIDQLKHDGDLPYHRLGRRLIVFKVEDLDVLMKNHRIDVVELVQ